MESGSGKTPGRSGTLTALLGLALMVYGCAPAVETALEERPRLIELTDSRPWAAPLPEQAGLSAVGGDYLLQVFTVQVPVDHPRLDLAGGLLEPGPFSRTLQQNWEREGFALGRLPRERIGFFLANLPLERWTETQEFRHLWRYEPLGLAGPSAGHLLRLHDPEARQMRVGPGEYRFLVKFTEALPTDGAPLRLELLPHYHRPRTELAPRTPEERMLDGLKFEHLTLNEPIDLDDVWVLHRRKSSSPSRTPATSETPSASEAAATLADRMLRGERQGRGVESVLLIGLSKRTDRRPTTSIPLVTPATPVTSEPAGAAETGGAP